jgi:hypothetical protein
MKKYVENNPNWFQLIEEPLKKEWEIVGAMDERGNIWYTDMLPSGSDSIYAVRRLSDREVFNIGDSVCLEDYPSFDVVQPIEKFAIVGDRIFAHYLQHGNSAGSYELQYIRKNPKHIPSNKQEPKKETTWDELIELVIRLKNKMVKEQNFDCAAAIREVEKCISADMASRIKSKERPVGVAIDVEKETPFEWTMALVEEFLGSMTGVVATQKDIDDFIKSKQPSNNIFQRMNDLTAELEKSRKATIDAMEQSEKELAELHKLRRSSNTADSKERIEVTELVEFDRAGSFVSWPRNRWQYLFYTENDCNIPKEKFPLIKSAIERVLNGENIVVWDKDGYTYMSAWKYNEDLEKAFNAARERQMSPITSNPLEYRGVIDRYKTFKDYKNSLK